MTDDATTIPPFNLEEIAARLRVVEPTPENADPIIPVSDEDEGDIGTEEAHKEADGPAQRAKRFFDTPRRRAPRKAPKVKPPIPPKPRAGALVRPLTDLYVGVGTMVLPFDQVCGTAIINSAEKCAQSLDMLARDNPAVRRAILRLVETSAWGVVITAHAPLLIAIAMHHVPAVKENLPPNVHIVKPGSTPA